LILVTGAAGKTGLAILRALSGMGIETRALVRNPEQESSAKAAKALQVLSGDLLDGRVVRQALQGVEAVYLICPNVHPQEFEIGKRIIASAKTAGVTRLIYHSVLYPQIEAMPHHWQKLRVEEALVQSGMDFSILQPASYMQNLLPYWSKIITEGVYRIPYSVNANFSPVHLEDVAEVASRVLTEPGHSATIYPLAGPEILNSERMVDLIGQHLGRQIKAETQSIREWEEEARAKIMGDDQIDAFRKMFIYYDAHGLVGNPRQLQQLLQRSPKRFSDFISSLEISKNKRDH